jgi:hypothetical protein
MHLRKIREMLQKLNWWEMEFRNPPKRKLELR